MKKKFKIGETGYWIDFMLSKGCIEVIKPRVGARNEGIIPYGYSNATIFKSHKDAFAHFRKWLDGLEKALIEKAEWE